MTHHDVIVVGLGAMGSSAVRHLARRSRSVLGIEQFSPAHELGSSHGASRIVRKAYFESPAYVPLLARSYELFDELSADYGEQLFTRCGALMIGSPDSQVVTGTLASVRRWDLPHEILDANQMRDRFPQFSLGWNELAVFEADAGFARPEATVLANLDLADAAGAELWYDTPVEDIQLGPRGVHVVAAGEEVTADKVVISTGAWASRLAGLDRYGFTVTRQVMHWFAPRTSTAAFDPEVLPVYLWEQADPGAGFDSTLYGFPHQAGDAGVKVAYYHDPADTEIDPDRLDRTVDVADAETLRTTLARAIPDLNGDWVSGKACMYVGVAGDDFVLGVHPGSSGRVVLAVGMSGHGFKFAPVVGEIVADLVSDGRSRLDIDFLAPARLTRSVG